MGPGKEVKMGYIGNQHLASEGKIKKRYCVQGISEY